jgi:DNA-binding CsgD family transcriptional regulator
MYIDTGTDVLYNEFMYLFERILRTIQGWFRRRPSANFTLDVHTLRSLQHIARQEQRTPEEIAGQILNDALLGHQAQGTHWEYWQSLTPREQEIAALVCMNYTTRQIASRLHISPETVKTHVERVLMKFGVADRNALRLLLSDWDFSAFGG